MVTYYEDEGDAILKTRHAQDVLLVVLQSLGRVSEKLQNGPNIITSSPQPFQQRAETYGLWVTGTFQITLLTSAPTPCRHKA